MGGGLSTALQAHVCGQTRAILFRAIGGTVTQPLVFFFVAKKKTRQPEGKAGTNRWPGSSTADNETCATFRKHSRRQEHDNVCGKISKMCGKKEGAGKRLPKPHGFISDGAREKSRACANSSEGRAGA